MVFRLNNIRLNIIGSYRDEDLKAKYENFVRANKLDNFIKFWGPKYNLEKLQIIFKCDILIYPSYNDVFPLVLLEAMQYGFAIITSDQRVILKRIKLEFGYVFPTSNENKVAFFIIGDGYLKPNFSNYTNCL